MEWRVEKRLSVRDEYRGQKCAICGEPISQSDDNAGHYVYNAYNDTVSHIGCDDDMRDLCAPNGCGRPAKWCNCP